MNLSTYELIKTADVGFVLSDEQVKALQGVLLDITQDVLDFCRENGLLVFLGGGSCLGALRHGGFIPWDDDMDLSMPRRDFDYLLAHFPERWGDKYWIHAPGLTAGYGSLVTRIGLRGSVVRKPEDRLPEECGACLDICVLENTYDAALRYWLHGAGCILLSAIVSCRRYFADRRRLLPIFAGASTVQRSIRLKAALGFFTAWLPLDSWVRIANNWNRRCRDESSRRVAVPTGRRRFFAETYDRARYCRTRLLPFEGRQWPVPAETESYMKTLYGDDYMQLPPPEKRETHAVLAFALQTPADGGKES